MNRGLSNRLHCLILGSAATGLLVPSSLVLGQSKSAVSPNKKKPAVVQVVEPPRLLSVPGESESGASPIQSVSQLELVAADKTDVQRELEALYQQDGREMPEMNMNLMPMTPTNTQPQQSATTNQTPTANPTQAKPAATQKPAARQAQTYPSTQARPNTNSYAPQNPPQVQTQNQAQAQRYPNLANDTSNPPSVLPQSKPAAQNSKFGFFKRLTATNTKPQYNPTPVPPDVNNIPVAPPTTVTNAAPTTPAQQGIKYYAPANQAAPTKPANQQTIASSNLRAVPTQPQGDAQFLMTNNSVTTLPQPAEPLPPLFQSPLPVPIVTSQPQPLALPPLMTEAQLPISATAEASQPATTTIAAPPESRAITNDKITFNETVTEMVTDFPNPFPETSEAEADGRSKVAKRREVSSKAYIDDEKQKPAVVKQAKPEIVQDTESKPIDDPFAVGAKNFAEPTRSSKSAPNVVQNDSNEFLPPIVSRAQGSVEIPVQSDQPNLAQLPARTLTPDFEAVDVLKAPPASVPNSAPAALSSVSTSNDYYSKLSTPTVDEEQQLEKMRKIRERFGMKGLKGFCPVTLHDERELVDAKSEFNCTHRSQKFHFASAEARDKFEADPVKYAPAAYGADVVALNRDRDVVEGTLDFAAWFKGRLYLFGSQENYEIFIENPAKFATLNGIE